MNKRDYFAAQAMQAIISKMPPMMKFEGEDDDDFTAFNLAVARGAYEYADAMMAVRKLEELGEE